MSVVSSIAQSPAGPERRAAARQKPSSIIYAHMGSENGGIVVNLGTGGVSFQAAMKVIAGINSPIGLRLKGSGLNVELPGEIVWLGAEAKKVGVSFKSPSPEVQQEIANWIARETGACETLAQKAQPAATKVPAAPRVVPELAALPPSGDKPRRNSLAAALAMSRAAQMEPPPPEDIAVTAPATAASPKPSEMAPSDPAPKVSEIVPAEAAPAAAIGSEAPVDASPSLESGLVPPAPVDQASQTPGPTALPDAELASLLTQLQGVQSALEASTSESSSPESPMELATVPPPEPHIGNVAVQAAGGQSVAAPPAHLEGKQRSAPPRRPLVRKKRVIASSVRFLDRLLQETSLGRWIPPAFLDTWKRSGDDQKLAIAGTSLACVGMVVLSILMVVGRAGNSVPKPANEAPRAFRPAAAAVSASLPASSVPADGLPSGSPAPAPAVSPPSPVPAATQTAATQPAPRPRAPEQPQPSLLYSFTNGLFGDAPSGPKIGNEQIGVQVWTSQSSGYYYCTDTDYYRTVQPGSFMAQGDALQSGYRPRLGKFCN